MYSTIRSKKKCSIYVGDNNDDHDEGLRLILKKLANLNSNNIVVKPISKPLTTLCCCYLKSCHLCSKPLSLDKEIYMYRGDLGFCSVECRDRQIYLDETKELEIATRKTLSTFRQSSRREGGGRCETRRLLGDIRTRRRPFPAQKSPIIFL
ncbi:Protein of unknown function (DUF581 [Striga hermonthica]|uniref:FLZ-type domain-containing protein n=1 Tax=Striga hermonthica TaxID=68872 RepID=A0A9N7R6R8_STRHE|nr:Protein of unknown function (DUF581 [Striga hermonthica]